MIKLKQETFILYKWLYNNFLRIEIHHWRKLNLRYSVTRVHFKLVQSRLGVLSATISLEIDQNVPVVTNIDVNAMN